MKKRVFAKRLGLCCLILVMACVGVFTVGTVNVNADSGNDADYELLAQNYLASQYNLKGLQYEQISLHNSVDLYDETENIVGKAVILDRDGELDYVVINLITNNVDEFGFNEESMTDKFLSGERIYYGGALNFSIQDGSDYQDFNGKRISRSAFTSRTKDFKSRAKKVKSRASSPDAGIVSWTDIVNQNAGNSNSDWGYLSGVNWNGITGSGLSFCSQNTFNINYQIRYGQSINGTCGPTATTNMYIYYKWLGFANALKNNSVQDTFERMLTLSNWNNGSYFNDDRNSLKSFATERGYSYDIDTYFWGTNWNAFKASIDKGRPVLTETKSTGYGHEVVVVGYEQFTYTYQVQVLWWWETRTTDYRYLRVIDGFDSSNSSRFVDYNGFYSTINGTDFMLK